MQDDQLFFREDLCHFPDRDDEKKPAEAAGADADHVRPIAAGCVPHHLDVADSACGASTRKTSQLRSQ